MYVKQSLFNLMINILSSKKCIEYIKGDHSEIGAPAPESVDLERSFEHAASGGSASYKIIDTIVTILLGLVKTNAP